MLTVAAQPRAACSAPALVLLQTPLRRGHEAKASPRVGVRRMNTGPRVTAAMHFEAAAAAADATASASPPKRTALRSAACSPSAPSTRQRTVPARPAPPATALQPTSSAGLSDPAVLDGALEREGPRCDIDVEAGSWWP